MFGWVGGALGWVWGRVDALGSALAGYSWGDFFQSPGFGGVAVVVAALITARGVKRSVLATREATHAQKEANAEAVTTQRRADIRRDEAARRDQWWARAQWALNLILSDRQAADRAVGHAVVEALAKSHYADTDELAIMDAAVDAAIVSFFEDVDNEDDDEASGPPGTGEAHLDEEAGGE